MHLHALNSSAMSDNQQVAAVACAGVGYFYAYWFSFGLA